jgi:HPt (histidine-containing phosphotransfer) domain-containing protein
MEAHPVRGIDVASLEEAFSGSEEVLAQMLSLFVAQAVERVRQLGQSLAVWDVMGARTVLHSLVNICGAVRAYGLSDLAKAVGDAVKRDDREQANALARELVCESTLVLEQARLLLSAAQADPGGLWRVALPAPGVQSR